MWFLQLARFPPAVNSKGGCLGRGGYINPRAVIKQSKTGRDSADKASKLFDEQTGRVTRRIGSFGGEIERSSEIVDLIAEIAYQANMLTLNISIEAAQASEDGAGDEAGAGVVADAVKILAEEVATVTDDINTWIGSV